MPENIAPRTLCRPERLQPQTGDPILHRHKGEAWLLGDIPAVKAAYPNARDDILRSYENDSICGTWELLAEAVFSGGASGLENKGWQVVGTEKSVWSEKIAPHMNVDKNDSPSFRYFREKVRGLAQATP